MLDLACHRLGRAVQRSASGDVQEGLVQGQPLHQVRELTEDGEHLARDLLVARHPRPHADGVRTAPQGLTHRHRGVDPEASRFVARRGDHATASGAADEQRLSRQRRVVVGLDRRVEGVHVHVQDRPAVHVPSIPRGREAGPGSRKGPKRGGRGAEPGGYSDSIE